MKDLKHLFYFENLLQEANNELVQQAKKRRADWPSDIPVSICRRFC